MHKTHLARTEGGAFKLMFRDWATLVLSILIVAILTSLHVSLLQYHTNIIKITRN